MMSMAQHGRAHLSTVHDDTFVLVARGSIREDDVLDLVDLAPSTIRVRWQDGGQVSLVSTGQFLDLWDDVRASTVVAELGPAGAVPSGERVRVLVRRPRIVGSGLRWTVCGPGTRGSRETGSCVLVINPPEARGEAGGPPG